MDEDDIDASLENYLAAEAGLPDDADTPIEAPRDADRANLYLRALRAVRRDRARIEARAAAEQERIARWAADMTAGLARREQQLETVLEGWMRAVNADTGHKSEALPNGRLSLAAPRWRVEVLDPDKLAEWLWAHRPDLLKIEAVPRKGDIQRILGVGPLAAHDTDVDWHFVVTDDGEQVPGVRMAKATRDTFTIR